MVKKYVLEIFLDDITGVAFHERADQLHSPDLRSIIAILEQIKIGMVLQLNVQSKTVENKPKQEGKAD